MTVFDLPPVEDLLRGALAEDLGAGDLTARLTVPEDRQAVARITAKADGVLAGVAVARKLAALIGGGLTVSEHLLDGARFQPGERVLSLRGQARALLGIERLTLNLLQQLSGVATLTARFVDAVQGTACRIADTRKTIPGLRILQKYAVRVGGGVNHRLRLDDGILIKNNHITAAGGVRAAVTAARAGAPHGIKVEVECTTFGEIDAALSAGAEIIMLDNMTVDEMRDAVRRIGGRAVVEASGGVSLATVRAIAETGVDIISIGALTHSAPAVDLHLTLRLE